MKKPLAITLLLLASVAHGTAQAPQQINYQGRVTVQGVNFTGSGLFKFALVDGGTDYNQGATAYGAVAGGQISQINVTNIGHGYTTAPDVTITGDGTGASAVAVLGQGSGTGTGPTDSVYQINITNAGTGYTYATVTVAPPLPDIHYTTFWSNDGSSTEGSEPGTAVEIPVTNGLYSVALGDTALPGMNMLPENLFKDRPDVRLRVWFDDGTLGSQLLTPDQRISAAPYAMEAERALNVTNAAISTMQLADDAVTAAKLAPASVTVDSLLMSGGNGFAFAPPNANDGPLVGQILASDGNGGFMFLEGGAVGWTLGGNAGTTSANFLGTTDAKPLAFRVNNEEVLRLDLNTDLLLPMLPAPTGEEGLNGLGSYVQHTFLGFPSGRMFGGADIDGPVLYGQGGGGLGVKKLGTVGNPLAYFEKTVLNWRENIINIYALSGFSIQAADRPMITRAYDPFTVSSSSIYHGHGRWGMFMEPGTLTLGVPSADVGARGFAVSRYDPNGAHWEMLRINNDDGKLRVNGLGQELAYLGGDGNGDVEFGSLNPDVKVATFWNPASARQLEVRGHSFTAAGKGNEQAYIGGDGNGDVEFGSRNANVTLATFWNPEANGGVGRLLDVKVRTLIIAGGADLAEPFAIGEKKELPKGTVVVIDETAPGQLKQSTRAYDTCVAGIISGANGIQPGISLKQEGVNDDGQQVSLTGRVYCKADASFGAIKPGDLLTTSSTPGHAMKAADHTRTQGAVLGKAMSALDEGTGFVLVLVTLQ